jgi:hypothetical protein
MSAAPSRPSANRILHQKQLPPNVRSAILTEGTNMAMAIVKQREAMASAGGETQIQLAFATNLLGKRIITIPSGNGINLQTFDLNKALEGILRR